MLFAKTMMPPGLEMRAFSRSKIGYLEPLELQVKHDSPNKVLIKVHEQTVHFPKLTVAPENRPGPKRKRSYSNHPFSGVNLLLVSGRVSGVSSALEGCESTWGHIFFATKKRPKWW